MNALLRRRGMMMAKQGEPAPVLPSGYQRVEWIGINNRQGQKIVLSNSAVAKSDLLNYSMRIVASDISTNTSLVNAVGIIAGTSSNAGCYFAVDKSGKVTAAYDVAPISANPISKQTYTLYWDDSGGNVECNQEISHRAFTSSQAAQLFSIGALAGSGYDCNSYRIYDVEVFHLNEKIIKFVPCYNKSSGTIGLYDVVNELFFTNSGAGNLIKGADVN